MAGYQKQPDDKGLTVQGCLEYGLSKICNEPIQIYGASRTDAGVHAKFQVCTFQTSGSIPAPESVIARKSSRWALSAGLSASSCAVPRIPYSGVR